MSLRLERSRISRQMSQSRALSAALLFAFSQLAACESESGVPSGVGGAEASGGAETNSGGAPGAGGLVPSGGAASGGVDSAGGAASGGDVSSGGAAAGSGGDASGGASPTGGTSSFVLSNPAFENVEGCSVEGISACQVIPDENVVYLDNANISPELHWTGVPEGTQSFALALFDVSYGQAHWVLWNIPPDLTMLPANIAQDTANPAVPAGSQQANANFATTSEHGYYGPHVPCNVYEFQLYALATNKLTPMDTESAVLVWFQLSEHPDLLGVARLRGRGNLTGCD